MKGTTTWRTIHSAVLAVVACVVLSACSGSAARDAEVLSAGNADVAKVYRLAPGDKLRVNVFGHPDVSGEFEVDGDGTITFPLLGQVVSSGRSVNELKEYIATELNENYLVDPRVSVEVLNYRPFYILGQVEQPGSYPFQSGMTVRQAVALAGGFTRRAVKSEVTLIRPTSDGTVEAIADIDAQILPGDTIEVDRRFF
ncbi:polysaccharide biosynthesis/export family protein [Ferruginivarius sediminum]|uniref:Polysaccharide export protein n=1 Tax=Ferruginivarius sediminum TaxID=2661937 RepID=A0A369TGC4_9PROT|nr:polysaccharide biosynthesis/export family protein [Ferruginivarius sediminum]RDD63177.1 polysaccharide export protein [Ferruginivarius sediminum]